MPLTIPREDAYANASVWQEWRALDQERENTVIGVYGTRFVLIKPTDRYNWIAARCWLGLIKTDQASIDALYNATIKILPPEIAGFCLLGDYQNKGVAVTLPEKFSEETIKRIIHALESFVPYFNLISPINPIQSLIVALLVVDSKAKQTDSESRCLRDRMEDLKKELNAVKEDLENKAANLEGMYRHTNEIGKHRSELICLVRDIISWLHNEDNISLFGDITPTDEESSLDSPRTESLLVLRRCEEVLRVVRESPVVSEGNFSRGSTPTLESDASHDQSGSVALTGFQSIAPFQPTMFSSRFMPRPQAYSSPTSPNGSFRNGAAAPGLNHVAGQPVRSASAQSLGR